MPWGFWYKVGVPRSNPHLSLFLGSVLLVSVAACGPSTGPQAPASDGADGNGGGDTPQDAVPAEPLVDPSDPSLEVDPQVCETDADCMVGTPRNCCISFCPEDRVAWSRAAWAAYQDDCAVEECANPESLACQPEHDPNPDAVAVCVRQRCVLR